MDFQGGWTGWIYRICDWIYKLAYLNLLWLVFTLAGFIIFGLGPSTIAMYSVMRKWINGDWEFPIFHTFLNFYKAEFKQANAIGLVLIVVGTFIIIDTGLIGYFYGALRYIVLGSFTTVLILYLIVVLYIFPIAVEYKNTTIQHFKSALIVGISSPIKTLVMVASVLSVLLICFAIPGVGLLYLGSGICFVTMFFSKNLLQEINQRQFVIGK